MQSLFYRLSAAVAVIAFLVGLALYIKSAGVGTPKIDELRAAGAGHPGPDLPSLMQLRDAARKNPESLEAQGALAKGLMRNGEYGPEAIEAFTIAIRLSPSDAELYFLRGKIHENTGNSDLAIPDYEQAARFNPKLAEAMIRRADIARHRGELDTAIPWYRQAVAAEPRNAHAHNNLGMALFQKGESTQAIAEFEAAVQIEPQDGALMHNLGNAYRSIGDSRNARDWFDRACKLPRPHQRSCTELRSLN